MTMGMSLAPTGGVSSLIIPEAAAFYSAAVR